MRMVRALTVEPRVRRTGCAVVVLFSVAFFVLSPLSPALATNEFHSWDSARAALYDLTAHAKTSPDRPTASTSSNEMPEASTKVPTSGIEPGSGAPAQCYVSMPAGFVRLVVDSNSRLLVAMPFQPFDGTLDSVFQNQLTESSDGATADHIALWDQECQQYVWLSKTDGHWRDAEGALATQLLNVGSAFWVENRHERQDIFLAGAVPLEDRQAMAFLVGLNLFGYPFASRMTLDDSALSASGAHGAASAAEADKIRDELGSVYWLSSESGDDATGHWLDETGGVVGVALTIGKGFWYERVGTNSFWWSEPRPYADAFSTGTHTPQIAAVYAAADRRAVTLSISCSGSQGEMLEIFYKDMGPTNVFVSESGWSVADEGITTTGRTSLTWTDSGSTNRSRVTVAFCRIYLVARQDIDIDGNGISDARELFVGRASDSGTDDGGSGSTDGQGQTNAPNQSPVEGTIYVDCNTGNDLNDGLMPAVADGHGPVRTVQAGVDLARSGGRVQVASGVYVGPALNFGSKKITIAPVGHVILRGE